MNAAGRCFVRWPGLRCSRHPAVGRGGRRLEAGRVTPAGCVRAGLLRRTGRWVASGPLFLLGALVPAGAAWADAATGAVTISGTAEVRATLTADTSAITDSDGLTGVSYSYQWVRVDGMDETNVGSVRTSTRWSMPTPATRSR